MTSPAAECDPPKNLFDPADTFHHLGVAVKSLEKGIVQYESLGYHVEEPVFSDPVLGITGVFLVGAGPRIELLQDLPGHSVVAPWLVRDPALYHYAYLVDGLDAKLEAVEKCGSKTLVPPTAAVGFGGRRVAFTITRHRLIVEYIERALRPDG
jgi:methylmalonyl-CoA/ethylmalonyl-CoA epimerase